MGSCDRQKRESEKTIDRAFSALRRIDIQVWYNKEPANEIADEFQHLRWLLKKAEKEYKEQTKY